MKTNNISLRDLIIQRIEELDLEIEKSENNGAHSTKNHLMKARNKNVEILFYIENGGDFVKREDDEYN